MESSRLLPVIFITFLLLVAFHDETTSSVLADTRNYKIAGQRVHRSREGLAPPTPSANTRTFPSPPPAPQFRD
ncbi:hypothetical protein FRX31_002624 [Thalictrum thalictroides]|uniref:Transmembrane protein n=1 Tax=Thalictrum thalictroides TaxID=46969 RepID=A0A7J6XFN4_THATH|nr:hypothetical protein FRX31_002624 [Thalictrum thalictroides]